MCACSTRNELVLPSWVIECMNEQNIRYVATRIGKEKEKRIARYVIHWLHNRKPSRRRERGRKIKIYTLPTWRQLLFLFVSFCSAGLFSFRRVYRGRTCNTRRSYWCWPFIRRNTVVQLFNFCWLKIVRNFRLHFLLIILIILLIKLLHYARVRIVEKVNTEISSDVQINRICTVWMGGCTKLGLYCNTWRNHLAVLICSRNNSRSNQLQDKGIHFIVWC